LNCIFVVAATGFGFAIDEGFVAVAVFVGMLVLLKRLSSFRQNIRKTI
jgi:hypothetical protein